MNKLWPRLTPSVPAGIVLSTGVGRSGLGGLDTVGSWDSACEPAHFFEHGGIYEDGYGQTWHRSAGRPISLLLVLAAFLGLAASASAQVDRWGTYAGAHVGDTETVPTPIANLKNVIAVDASNMSTYALESNGTVWATGGNGRGELGDNSFAESAPEAVQVEFPAGVKIVAIGEAENSGFAIDSTGQGWTWGEARAAGRRRRSRRKRCPG